MDGSQVAEVVLVAFCGLLFAAYFANYFWLGKYLIFKNKVSLWNVGVDARKEWAIQMMKNPKDSITAIQGLRNGALGATILGTAAAQMASRVIVVLCNQETLAQIRAFGESDPITGGSGSIASPEVKLTLALGTLLLSLMCLAQFVRFSLHLMYVMNVVASDPDKYRHLTKLVRVFIKRSSIYFALGLRFLFLFLPAIMWCVGILALLITTVVQISVMVVLDIVPVSEEWNERQRDVLEEDERRLIEGPHPASGEEAAPQQPTEAGKAGKAGANAGQAQKAAAEDDAAAETAAVAAAAVAAM